MSEHATRGSGAGAVFSRHTGHEQVVFCHDEPSGLRAIIAIYSTALGPALGGTRFYPYADEDDAIDDVLALSKGMAYKNALAGLDLGGGKAVIIGDPAVHKTEALLRAYGRFVASLGGRYYTACDVGTYVPDMDVIARECRWTTGRSVEAGGAGDSSVLTAYGVYQGMRASAQHLWGGPSLSGRRVGVAGVGKVGRHLVGLLLDDGAEVVVTDVSEQAVDRITAEYPAVDVVDDNDTLVRSDLDIYSPCALGGVLDGETAAALRARLVCGAANNQLADHAVGKQLAEHGVLYAPDYLVNAGGVIQVEDEIHGFSFERAKAKAARIFDTTLDVYRIAAEENLLPVDAADRIAERRMASVGRLRGILLP
ncbi:Glu/Leu/Phe/Val dehydrogenase dimerization domain-containing protein [Allonocardiopsis opalescens]|uniref:Valine dehydrogenase (NAD+) n=1 Tax=Allonocardiopsis opalescens TaxID=1144618 RepID=A0A2T0Q9H5_9ACTN|nr:Glu/Leu/Phe/Val dehydrogenase dimerization domain-containing protein [Allonocardiopsis opalescens]PRY00503.1 valine dehydrogenase (NAD+) [Allonocardiopsis opalescens]